MRLCPPERLGRIVARCTAVIASGLLVLILNQASHAAIADIGWESFRAGDYERALALAEDGQEASPLQEDWHRIEVECLLALGRYTEAHEALLEASSATRVSISLREPK